MKEPDVNNKSIAIIGMSCRFPGASSVGQYWDNLVSGIESISRFGVGDLSESGLDADQLLKDPCYVPARGIMERAEWFDAGFFGFNPKEAEVLDPQQRLFLEVCWEALEAAGYDPRAGASVGIFAGSTTSSYYHNNICSRPDVIRAIGEMPARMGNEKDFLATRIAYKLDLRGPAVNINTACSTSLVAVCQACQALWSYQCDSALAGGVSISFPQKRGVRYQEGGIFSPDGHCRPFDAKARGTVSSSGAGVVLLKRLAEAVADGDTIHAVIRGCGLNNDGSGKVGFTAPSVEGQAEAIAMAMAQAGVDADSISFVEAHGTATPLGDPIEIGALTQAFRLGTQRAGYCAIGSVKGNIGHADSAAGVAGLIKAALSLRHGKLPPSLHFEEGNPQMDIAGSPFFVASRLVPLERGQEPRRAGVSSFGLGGTNAHVILEESPAPAAASPSRENQLLLFSARTTAALDAAQVNLLAHLRADPDIDLADAAYTLQLGRAHFEHRRVLVCGDAADAAQELATPNSKRVVSGQTASRSQPQIMFMFPGQGAQHVGMGFGLYQNEPVFRNQVDRCAEVLCPITGVDIRSVMFGADDGSHLLGETRFAQPCLFVLSYALARLWMSWGIQPRALIGHSVGEYVAACLSGVFNLSDALALVARRAQLAQAQPPGSMLALRLPTREVVAYLSEYPTLSLAAVNSPKLSVVSGPAPALENFESFLRSRKVIYKQLATSHAFHSAMMDPVIEPLEVLCRQIKLHPPSIPYISNLTGTWITSAQALDPGYWARHLRQTVRFSEGLAEMAKVPGATFLEVGPGQGLCSFARAFDQPLPAISCLAMNGENDQSLALEALGRLWLAGASIDWKSFYGEERRRRVALPTYPFERSRYWVEPGAPAAPMVIVKSTATEPPEDSAMYDETVAADDVLPAMNGHVVPEETLREKIRRSVTAIFQELSGNNSAELPVSARFAELGLDSLLLAQASQNLQQCYGIAVPFRRLQEDLGTLGELVSFLEPRISGKAVASITPTPAAPSLSIEQFPLSEPQKEVWLAAQTSGDASRAFNQVFAINLAKNPGDDFLRELLQQLVDRHDALRATYAPDGSTQIVSSRVKVAFETRDVDGPDEAALAQAMEQAERAFFDLERGPIFRALLLRLRGGRCSLILSAHHLILDGWSMGVLLREFSQLYQARAAGASAELPPAMQYCQYVQWRNSAVGTEAVSSVEDYWVKQFTPPPPDLEIPSDRPRPPVKTYRALEAEITLNAVDCRELKRAAAAENCTLFVMLLAGLNAWLYRLTGQDDLVVAVPVAGQLAVADHPGNRSLVGHCVNSLPVRCRCNGEWSFAELLREVKALILDAYDHQNFTLATLVRRLNLRSNPSRSPLASLMFNLGRGSLQLRAPGASLVFPAKSFNFFDMSIEAHDSGEDLRIVCRFNAGLYDRARIQRMLGDLQTLLRAATAQPKLKLREFLPGVAADYGPFSSAKASRTVLPEPDRTADQKESAAELTPTEKCLTEIWSEVLGVKEIGLHDNFFDLGGHSLLATRIVSRLRGIYSSNLELISLFQFPTVAGLAALIDLENMDMAQPEDLERLMREIEEMPDEQVNLSR